MRAQKIAQALLLMENFFEFVQDQYSYTKYRIESEEKIVGLIQQIIDVKKTTLIPKSPRYPDIRTEMNNSPGVI